MLQWAQLVVCRLIQFVVEVLVFCLCTENGNGKHLPIYTFPNHKNLLACNIKHAFVLEKSSVDDEHKYIIDLSHVYLQVVEPNSPGTNWTEFAKNYIRLKTQNSRIKKLKSPITKNKFLG
jgi:hypothetical protein